MSSDTTWRRGVERLASTVGIGADQLAAFEQELYDLKSEYESWKRNDPGPTAAARRKLETLRRGLKDALNEYVSLGQGITIKYWWTAYRSLWRKSNVDVSSDIEALCRMLEAADWSIKNLSGKQGGKPNTVDRDALFALLAKLYEEYTGRRYRYPDKRDRFHGSTFVARAAKIIDPKLTKGGMDRGAAAAAKVLKTERKLENTRA